VKQTASAGRGVFAIRDIAQGEFIHFAEPIVAHPKLGSISKVWFRTRKFKVSAFCFVKLWTKALCLVSLVYNIFQLRFHNFLLRALVPI
jgi:hypothetical protein